MVHFLFFFFFDGEQYVCDLLILNLFAYSLDYEAIGYFIAAINIHEGGGLSISFGIYESWLLKD